MIKKEMIAMLLAGGQGSRLGVLTSKVAKPAVSFGGKYRIIDFPLSNCINSGIDTVGVLTQYRPLELNNYIGNGQPWDLDRSDGGVHILPPYQSAKGATWFKGTANAIYQNISFIDSYDPEYVIILSGDQICKQDYADFLRTESDVNAALLEIEDGRREMPVLIRQYLKLGGRIAAFNVDPDFGTVVDGLIVVDLLKAPPRDIARYMGKTAYEAYVRAPREE